MKNILVICLSALFAPMAFSATLIKSFELDGQKLVLELVVKNQGVIWGIDFISENDFLFTTREGRLKRWNSGTLTELPAPSVHAGGQGGLLDIRIDPNFANNRYVYLTYSKSISSGKIVTALSRSKLGGAWQDIYVSNASSSTGIHFGSRIAFDKDGLIYMSIGDRGTSSNAQDLTIDAGKILRIKPDGHAPKTNPFTSQSDARPAIFSYGHRNPQGLTFVGSKLYSTEHGPRGGDEINLVRAGKNYGWPVISFGKDYSTGDQIGEGFSKPGMEPPLKYYVPSIATCGLDHYPATGEIIGFRSSLFGGALAYRHVNQVKLTAAGLVGKETRHFAELKQRVRSIRVSPSQRLYFSTDSGNLYRVRLLN